MPLHGFGILARTAWTKKERAAIKKYFGKRPSDWRKRTLAFVRHKVKQGLLTSQAFRCAYCRMPIADRLGYSELDHVIAKEHCPQFCYTMINLVLACKRCNQRKGRHNPTTLTLKAIGARKGYFKSAKSFRWIHPFFHDYDQHIEIEAGRIFSARRGSVEGLAVIKACGLDQMSAVVSRARFAKAIAAANDLSAILEMAGAFPDESVVNIAASIQSRPGIKMSRGDIEEMVARLRSHDPASLLTLLRRA